MDGHISASSYLSSSYFSPFAERRSVTTLSLVLCIFIVTVFFIVSLVMISWAADGFASSVSDVLQATHGVAKKIEYSQGCSTGVRDWDHFNIDTAHHFECPLSHKLKSIDV